MSINFPILCIAKEGSLLKVNLKNLNEHKDFYDAGGELAILISKVKKAGTANELIKIFNLYTLQFAPADKKAALSRR